MENFENFDWKTYLQNYSDLGKAGINNKYSAWRHWIKFGKNEGRTYKTNIIMTNNYETLQKNNSFSFQNLIYKNILDYEDCLVINYLDNNNIKII